MSLSREQRKFLACTWEVILRVVRIREINGGIVRAFSISWARERLAVLRCQRKRFPLIVSGVISPFILSKLKKVFAG